MKKTHKFVFAGFLAFALTVAACSSAPVIREFKITFVNDDQTELSVVRVKEGEKPVYDKEEPSKASTDQYDYTFDKWVPEIVEAKEDTTYTASYKATVRKYLIKFVSEGVTLQSSEVEYGALPVYEGGTPGKASTESHTYTFSGWDKEVVKVTGPAIYTATFSEEVREYTIKFVNGEDVLQSGKVAYGTLPVYEGETPEKEADEHYSYIFEGWDPEISSVKEDKTYEAKFHRVSHGICVDCGEFFDSEKIASYSLKDAKLLEDEEPALGFKEVYGKVGFDNGSVGVDLDLSKYTSVYFALAHSMSYVCVFGGNAESNARLWQNDWYQILLERDANLEWQGFYKKTTDEEWTQCAVDYKNATNLSQILTMYHWNDPSHPEDTHSANLRCSEIYAADKHNHVADEYGFCPFCKELVDKVEACDRAIKDSELTDDVAPFGFESVYSITNLSNGNAGSSFAVASYSKLYFSISHDIGYVYLFGGNGDLNPCLWQYDWYNILLFKESGSWKCYFKKSYETTWTTNKTKVDGATDENFSSILRFYNWGGLSSATIKCTEVYGVLAD